METSKGSAAFDEETPAKSDKKRKGGVPKAKAEDDDGGASQRDPAGRRRKRARGDRSDVILEGSLWAFCFPTHVDPLFVFLVNNRRELWRRRSVFPALNVVQWQLATARWFFQVHVWAGTVWNPATG